MDFLEEDEFSLFFDEDAELVELTNYICPDRDYEVKERIEHIEKWNDKEFFKRFRISKKTAVLTMHRIEIFLKNNTERNLSRAVTPMNKLLLTLRFMATGNFYMCIGDFVGIHPSTAGKIIHQGINALCTLFPDVVHLPQSEEERMEAKAAFFNLYKFPRVIGAIDCTHVRLQSPGGDNAENFRNRKGYFSLNCQVTCSANLKIIDLVSRWPGAAHDNHIFVNCNLRNVFLNGQMGNAVLLGDRGYGLSAIIQTPMENPQREHEILYNESHIRTRNVIERMFGVWKRHFPILSKGIRCKIQFAQKIVAACAILHNIAVDEKEEECLTDDEDEEEDEEEEFEYDEEPENRDYRRSFLAYFENLLN